jgi:hypothetical protein
MNNMIQINIKNRQTLQQMVEYNKTIQELNNEVYELRARCIIHPEYQMDHIYLIDQLQ